MNTMIRGKAHAASILRNNLHPKYFKNAIRQTRSVSFLNNYAASSDVNHQLAKDLDHAIALVRKYDPSGYLPGFMAATREARTGYFASKELPIIYFLLLFCICKVLMSLIFVSILHTK